MRSANVEGRLQITAATAALEGSRLVVWSSSASAFQATSREKFEAAWRKDIHPVFGRLLAWIQFSHGMELFVKGALLSHSIEVRSSKSAPYLPKPGKANEWASDFYANQSTLPRVAVTSFGTLGNLTERSGGTSRLDMLCDAVAADQQSRELVWSSMKLLQSSIRNRDAHAYVPHTRDDHYHLVPEVFCVCLNLIAGWLPGGPACLTEWKGSASGFVHGLAT